MLTGSNCGHGVRGLRRVTSGDGPPRRPNVPPEARRMVGGRWALNQRAPRQLPPGSHPRPARPGRASAQGYPAGSRMKSEWPARAVIRIQLSQPVFAFEGEVEEAGQPGLCTFCP